MKISELFQVPNYELSLALVALLISHFTHGSIQSVASSIFYVALAIWAYLEAKEGINWFRKGLGFFFLIYIIVGLAQKLPR